jgi:hypothetical protein
MESPWLGERRRKDVRAALARINRHRQHTCWITAQALDTVPAAERMDMLVL